jgi:WD40 repeat protein
MRTASRRAALASAALLACAVLTPAVAPPVSTPEARRARADLSRLRARAATKGATTEELWKLWRDFRVEHPRSPEYFQAAEVMANVPSPLDALDAKNIPAQERLAWLPKEVVAVLGEHRGRHWGGVRSLAVSLDGKLIAAAGGTVRLWGSVDLLEKATVPVRPGTGGVAFAPKGRLLATAHDAGVELWDLSGPAPVRKAALAAVLGYGPHALAFSRDGRRLVASGNEAVCAWDLGAARARLLLTDKHERWEDGRNVALSPDGRWLVDAGARKEAVRLFDLDSGKKGPAARLARAVPPLAFAPEGNRLVTMSGPRGPALLWEVGPGGGTVVDALAPLPRQVTWLAFAPRGKLLALRGRDGNLVLWPLDDAGRKRLGLGRGEQVKALPLPLPRGCFAFLPDGKGIAVGCADGTIRLWDLEKAAERVALAGPRGATFTAAFAPDGRSLAAGGQDGVVRWWSLEGGRPKLKAALKGHRGEVSRLFFGPRGRHLISFQGAVDRQLIVWDLGQARGAEHELGLDPADPLCDASLSTDGKTFVTAGGEFRDLGPGAGEPDDVPVLRLCDFRGGRLLPRREARPSPAEKGRDDYVRRVRLSPDGKRLAYVLRGGAVRVGVLTDAGFTERPLGLKSDSLFGLAFAPDGVTLAVAGWENLGDEDRPRHTGMVWLWDVGGARPRLLRRLQGERGDDVARLAFSADGKRLATVSREDVVSVWDLPSGKRAYRVKLPSCAEAVFAPDSRHLATANGNGTVYVFRLPAPPRPAGKR